MAALARADLGLALAGLSAAAVVLLLVLAWGGGRDKGAVALVLVAAVVSCGFFGGYLGGSLRVTSLLEGELAAHVQRQAILELMISGPVRHNGGWQSAVAEVVSGEITGGNATEGGALQVVGETLWLEICPDTETAGSEAALDGAGGLDQGYIVRASGTLRQPEGPTASGFDQSQYLRRQGIAVVFRVEAEDVGLLGRRGGVAGVFDHLRREARDHLQRGPDPRLGEVLQGVVMADKEGLDDEWLEAFRRSGTAHMLAVSGLHVGSLAALVLFLARRSRLPRGVGFVGASAMAFFMVPFSGSSPSVMRAAVMVFVVLMGQWLGRSRDRWQVLALAALVVLSLDPFAVYGASFQLSFAAVAGVMALSGRLERLFSRLPSGLAGGLSVSLAATAGTAPVALATFGQTSIVSAVANVLVVPFLPLVLGLGMASVFLGFAWHGLSAALDTAAAVPLAWILRVAQAFALAPVLRTRDLWQTVTIAGGFMLALPAALAVNGGPSRLGSWPGVRWIRARRPRRKLVAAAIAVAILGFGCALGAGLYPMGVATADTVRHLIGAETWPATPELRILDVGQGSATLLRTPDRRAVLFDGGPEGCSLEAQLKSLGVERLDLVVISHPHADHFAGLLECLDALEVGMLVDAVRLRPTTGSSVSAAVDSGGGGEALAYLEFRSGLEEAGTEYVEGETGMTLRVGGSCISLFAPTEALVMTAGPRPWEARTTAPTGDELNGGSLVAHLEVGTAGVLLPGDAEADILRTYGLPRSEVLVVAHHGSRGAVTPALLETLGLRAACVSVGKGNTFGHPDPATVSVLGDRGCLLARTDDHGWISCTIREGGLVIATERGAVGDSE